jgi:hypothetical protein
MKEKIKKYWLHILGFIFLWLIFRTIWGWLFGFWVTILVSLFIYGVYSHGKLLGECEGKWKVLGWLKRRGQKSLADSYFDEEEAIKL